MQNLVVRQMRNIAKSLLPVRLQRKLEYCLDNTPPQRWFGRTIGDYLENRTKHHLFGSLAPLVPRVEDMFDGPQNLELFKANGDEFLRIYRDLCGLGPSEKMLDVGCGIGRKTLPLTHYLAPEATYDGIDINKKGIEWCQQRIGARFPNFRFQQIDVYNKHYNPQGRGRPADYRFPFESESFDFVMLGSVLTHMPPEDGANYLSEVHRVLRRGGRCLITYFLLTDESVRAIKDGKSSIDFKHQFEHYRAMSLEMQELAIAYDEKWVCESYRRIGLTIARLEYGSWYGRTGCTSYQDLTLAIKALYSPLW